MSEWNEADMGRPLRCARAVGVEDPAGHVAESALGGLRGPLHEDEHAVLQHLAGDEVLGASGLAALVLLREKRRWGRQEAVAKRGRLSRPRKTGLVEGAAGVRVFHRLEILVRLVISGEERPPWRSAGSSAASGKCLTCQRVLRPERAPPNSWRTWTCSPRAARDLPSSEAWAMRRAAERSILLCGGVSTRRGRGGG